MHDFTISLFLVIPALFGGQSVSDTLGRSCFGLSLVVMLAYGLRTSFLPSLLQFLARKDRGIMLLSVVTLCLTFSLITHNLMGVMEVRNEPERGVHCVCMCVCERARVCVCVFLCVTLLLSPYNPASLTPHHGGTQSSPIFLNHFPRSAHSLPGYRSRAQRWLR